ncbi:MAG: hypothetical protein HC765_00340 [Brachymonas sp.]|nr:hypothetical protein [Brachymonas sp.]
MSLIDQLVVVIDANQHTENAFLKCGQPQRLRALQFGDDRGFDFADDGKAAIKVDRDHAPDQIPQTASRCIKQRINALSGAGFWRQIGLLDAFYAKPEVIWRKKRRWPVGSAVLRRWCSLFHRLDHMFDDLFRIAKHHHGFVHVEKFVV